MFQRFRLRIAAVFPLGIAARLTLSFMAVAVLAATANFIARETVSIIYLPQHEAPVAVAPVPALTPVVIIPQPATHAALTAALQAFEFTFQQRLDNNSKAAENDFAKASEALRHTAAGTASLEASTAEVLTRAQRAAHLGDQRRAERVAYTKLTDTLYQRLRTSLDGSLKIFGRVLARQSLVQLRNEFDHISALSQSLAAGDTQTADDRESLSAAENKFLDTLSANQSSLERSEGKDWVSGMGNDFAKLTAARASLEQTIVEAAEAVRQATLSRAALSSAILATDLAADRAYAAQTPRAPSGPLASLALPPDGVAYEEAEAQEAQAAAQAAQAAAQTAARDSNRQARNVMASVTLLVMLLVMAISLATVRSVSAPVRRILDAAKRLASGNAKVPVPRGGIRELDTLAAAFNSMAADLSAAQEATRLHQATLENKVLERTHKLRQLAQQDPLTSLPNRRHLLALLNHSLENAARENLNVWVYFIDLDNFKNFNDSEGHVFGDRVLMSVANRLEEIADGLGFVARLGGDEFTLVCDQAVAPETVQSIGRRIVNAFQKLISVDQRDLSVSVSVGASVFPEHGRDAESLLRAADSALFRAKELGRSQVAVFTPELIESAAARFTIEQGLRRALEARQFELHFQPEFSLATAEMVLVEALLRWRMPDGRLARPGEFLAVAEQSGLMPEINDWVLRSAIEAASRWHHGDWPSVKVAINISSRQLMDPRFADTLLGLMHEHRLPAACVELELTETVLQTGPATIAALRTLHAHGFGIALDDFGTGYSSVTSLEQLPLSRIKLDRSLIARIDTSQRSAAIARAIIDLCAGLSLEVTAEGVERPQQLAWLMNSPSLIVQGFLLSDAIPFSQVTQSRSILARVFDDMRLSAPAPLRPVKDARRATALPVPLKHWR